MSFPKIAVGIVGDIRKLDPKDAEMIRMCLQAAADMINNADHEKIAKQYAEGRMSQPVGFTWFMDDQDK